jgi:hypothetical protein
VSLCLRPCLRVVLQVQLAAGRIVHQANGIPQQIIELVWGMLGILAGPTYPRMSATPALNSLSVVHSNTAAVDCTVRYVPAQLCVYIWCPHLLIKAPPWCACVGVCACVFFSRLCCMRLLLLHASMDSLVGFEHVQRSA